MGSLLLLQEIFPSQGLNPSLPLCRQILYQLSHKGSPRILGWVAYPFSSTYYKMLNIVPCVTQEALLLYLFYIQ